MAEVDELDVITTWRTRPYRIDYIGVIRSAGCVYLASSADRDIRFKVEHPDPRDLRPMRSYCYRMIEDEVYDTGGKTAFLLHKRQRIMCEGITVDEQIEDTASALARGEYHKFP